MKNFRYSAITIVSPMISNGESKNQDRARWSEPCQTACVCDGVTTSPHSAEAAEYVTAFMPSVFSDNPVMRLEMIADIQMKFRSEACLEQPVIPEGKYSAGMQKMLIDVMRHNNTASYQTTAIAARFGNDKDTVAVDIIRCGDSDIFAFSPNGSLLSSSRQFNSTSSADKADCKQIIFGPGDEILVRVEGRLSEHKSLARKSDVKPEFAGNWLVCTPVDSCSDKNRSRDGNLPELKTLHLTEGDKLIVPEYLYGRILTSQGRHYRVLKFSSTIKAVSQGTRKSSKAGFKDKGSATNVLPDHFYSGNFDLFKDSFPAGTNFVLCSDGFYSAFDDFDELYSWLKENEEKLNNPADRESVMEKLHQKLAKKSGDDDISFIWAMPGKGGDEDD